MPLSKEDVEVVQAHEFELVCELVVTEVFQVGPLLWPSGERGAPCTQPAAAVMLCLTKGGMMNVCNGHRAEILTMPECMCGLCRTVGAPADLVRFEPIGRS